jgi:hypothetical protein
MGTAPQRPTPRSTKVGNASSQSKPSARTLEVCKNCGETIGALESACIFGEVVVCERCHKKLTGRASEKRGVPWVYVAVGAGCLAVSIAIFAFHSSASRKATPPTSVQEPLPSVLAAPSPTIPTASARPIAHVPQSITTPAELPPPAAIPTLTISGAAWIMRENGDTVLQRGLRVQLLRPTVTSASVTETLQAAIPTWQKLAADYRDMANDVDKQIASFGDADGSWSKRKAEELNTAREYDSKVANFRSFIASAPAELTLDSAYSIVSSASTDKRVSFEAIANASKVFEVKADADGKYVTDGIPPGRYYVHASIDTTLMFVEWLVPVQIEDKPVKLDLDNDNARVIQNYTP